MIALAFVASSLLPSLVSLFDPSFDHCRTHDDGHAHLCLIHLPRAGASGIGWLLASLPIAWVAAGCVDDLWAVWQARRAVRAVRATCRNSGGQPYLELPVDYPLCVAVGLWNPVVVVSTGLINAVSPEVLQSAMAHELAHVRRHDTLTRVLARIATLLYWPTVRREMMAALELAAEQACDDDAAESVGDRLQVAEAILAVERVLADAPAPLVGALASSFARGAAEARVEALVAERLPRRAATAFALAPASAAIGLLLASDHVHHLTESLLSGLLH